MCRKHVSNEAKHASGGVEVRPGTATGGVEHTRKPSEGLVQHTPEGLYACSAPFVRISGVGCVEGASSNKGAGAVEPTGPVEGSPLLVVAALLASLKHPAHDVMQVTQT